MRIYLAIVLTVGFALTAAGQSTVEALKNLESAMRKELNTSGNRPDQDRRREAERFVISGTSQIETDIDSGELYRVEDVLSQVGLYFSSEEVRQQVTALRAAIKRDRETKENARIAEINTKLKQAGDAIRNAKNPEDLDETLKNLSSYRKFSGSQRDSEEAKAVVSKLQSNIQFVRSWQEYLAARKSDNRERCRQALQNLTSGENIFEFMPRSQLLAELEKYIPQSTPRPETRTREATGEPASPEQVAAVVSKAKTLDAIPDAINELRIMQMKIRPSPSSSFDVLAMTMNSLSAVQKVYREFQAGFPTRLDNPQMYNPDMTSPAVIPLRAQLLLLILPRYLGVSGDLMPQSAETVDQYLQRTIDQAKKRADGGLLMRAMEAQRTVSGSSYVGPESAAVSDFSAAQNQEAAGEIMLAVVSYQQALKAGGDAIPVKFIGERLATLKAQHPAEYEEGVKRFNNPPRWDNRFLGHNLGFSYTPSSDSSTSLVVPAATATATPAPSISPKQSPKASPSSTPRSKRP